MNGLFLSRLTLSHFRSHKRLDLELDSRPVAIFGPNGAGKTNILEAISMLSPGRGLRRAATDDMRRRPEALGWKVTATLHDHKALHDIATWVETGGSRNVRINNKASSQTALGHLAKVLWLVPSMDRLWLEGADGRRRFLDRTTLSFVPDHAETVLSYEKAMRERNRLLKDQQRDSHWYAALEAQMAEAGAKITVNRTLAIVRLIAAQTEAETAFPVADLALTNAEDLPTDAAALREALAASRPRDLLAGRTLIGPHRADLVATYQAKGMAARDCSTGEQKALLVSLILANCRALAEDTATSPILLLDEIAAHLDSDRRAALYDEICALGSQAFMTGTGAELFEDLDARARHLEVTEEAGLSVVRERKPT